MKKIFVIIIYVVVATIIVGYCLGIRIANSEQRNYLPKLLAKTEKIIIHEHPKIGNRIIAEITNETEIEDFVEATKVTFMQDPCACFGWTEIDFILDGNQTVSLNYKGGFGDSYIKYINPWKMQAIPSWKFHSLIKKYYRNKN